MSPLRGKKQADTASSDETKPLLSTLLNEAESGRRYRGRFFLVYGLLALALAGIAVGFAVFITRPDSSPTAQSGWSPWTPTEGNVDSVTSQISEYITERYRKNESGERLVTVTSTPAAWPLPDGTKLPITTIFVRQAPNVDEGMRILDGSTRLYEMCGLEEFNCSIPGTPEAQRDRILNRQALELALYTFKFVPSVDVVVAHLPPPPSEVRSNVLLFEKDALREQLSQPLSRTLPLSEPPLPSEPNHLEAATINELTRGKQYAFSHHLLPAGSIGLLLDPATSAAPADPAAEGTG